MRFEKISENKIRITLSHEDLEKKDIDFHSFMSNSIESQDLFFDMLEEAEKKIGFDTKDYLIRIEALAMAGGDFVLTVTRSLPNIENTDKVNSFKIKDNKGKKDISNKLSIKKVQIKRKFPDAETMQIVYLFNSFDDYCSFLEFYKNNFSSTSVAKKVILYEYNDKYHLVLDNINPNFSNLKRLFSCITEFATYENKSEIYVRKLAESGKIIIKHNAILTGIKHFAN